MHMHASKYGCNNFELKKHFNEYQFINLFLSIFYFMHMCVLNACTFATPHVCLVPADTRKGIGFP